MADNTENIGGISVDIVGDYSQLQADLATAQQVAETAGADIAGALNIGARGADELGAAMTAAAGSATTFEGQIQALVDSGSTLAEALAQVQGAATDISSALNDTGTAATEAAQQLQLFDEAASVPYADEAGQLNLFATELEPIGVTAETAAAGLDQVNESAAGVAAGAETGAGGLQTFNEAETETVSASEAVFGALQDLGNQFLALAEAFVITEGLKEFGSEALDASDSITKATVSLTALTGSAETAETTIQGLETLGMQDGLAMPSLLTAATRMEAMLPAGTDVATALGDVANAATVMGNDIGTAASSFDRMVSSGTLGARQLIQLGLSLTDVANAMNAVTGNADATAANVAKLFKSLDTTDPTQGLLVLETALDKLGGIAQTVAEQTFGGQWQTLANQWEQIMVEVGNAILPVISGLTDLMKVDILPWIKDVVDDFSQLPGPMKDAIVVIGLLAAAVPVVTLALGAFGLAISGVGEVVPIVTGLVATLTGLWAGEAAAEGVATAATITLAEAQQEAAAWLIASGTAAETATGEVAGLGAASATAAGESGLGGLEAVGTGLAGILGVALVSAAAGAVLAFVDLGNSMAELTKKEQDMNTAFLQFVNSMVSSGSTTLDAFASGALSAADAASKIQGNLDKVNASLANNLITFQQASPVIQKLTGDMNALAGIGVTKMLDDMGVHITFVSSTMTTAAAAADGYTQHIQYLQDAVTKTAAALVNAETAYQNHTATLDAVNKAYVAYQSALDAATKSTTAAIEPITQLEQATHDFVYMENYVPTATQAATDAWLAQGTALTTLEATLRNAQTSLDYWVQQDQTNVNVQQQVVYWYNAVNTAQTALNNATDQGTASQTAMYAVLSQINSTVMASMPTSVKALNQALTEMGLAATTLGPPLDNAAEIMASVGVNADGVSKKMEAQITAYQNLATVSGNTLPIEDGMWNAISGSLNKIATNDMPKVIALYQQHIQDYVQLNQSEGVVLQTENAMYALAIKQATAQGDIVTAGNLAVAMYQNQYNEAVKMNQPLGDQLTALQNLYQQEIKNASQTGADASAEVIALNNVQLAQQALITQAQGWGAVEVGVTNDIIKGLENIGQPIAQVIVEGGNMSAAFVKIGEQIAETCITTIIDGGIKLVISSLLTGLIPAMTTVGNTTVNLGSSIASMFGSVSKAAVGSVSDIGNSAVDLGNTVDQLMGNVSKTAQTAVTGTANVTTSVMGSMASSFMSTLGAVGAVIGAIAGIIGDIQNIHIENLLGEIEVSTRGSLAEALNLRADLWTQSGDLLAKLDDLWGTLQIGFANEFQRLGDIWNTLQGQGGSSSDDIVAAIAQLDTDMGTDTGILVKVLDTGFSELAMTMSNTGMMPQASAAPTGAPGAPAGASHGASVSSSVSNSQSNSVVNSGGNTTNNINLAVSGGDPAAASAAIMKMLKALVPSFSQSSS